jgi:branched-chain amino acid transport system substrate-binding protein
MYSWKKLALAAIASAGLLAGDALAQAKEVKIGFIAPLSGPWARQGEMMKKGADLAIEDINAAGGVKALGGAKLKLVAADAGDSAEKAKNAAQRLLAENPDMVGGTGAWLSSFTLAVTEVTERAGVPWITLSYSDQITDRGFHYVFQTSAPGSEQAALTLPLMVKAAVAAGRPQPKTFGWISDNTASPMSLMKQMREKGLKDAGLELVVDEVFTPPLADATSSVQKARRARPDLLLLNPTSIPDLKSVLEKLKEFGLTGKMVMFGNGAHNGTPELLKLVGKDILEGYAFSIANWPAKRHADLEKRFIEKTGEPWMGQDPLCTYGDVQLLKSAMEMAKSADPKKVGEALHKIDEPAGYYAGGRTKFDEKGRRVGAGIVLVQWQNGLPVAVYPEDAAASKMTLSN